MPRIRMLSLRLKQTQVVPPRPRRPGRRGRLGGYLGPGVPGRLPAGGGAAGGSRRLPGRNGRGSCRRIIVRESSD